MGTVLGEVNDIGSPRIALVTTAESAMVHGDPDQEFQDAAFLDAGVSCLYVAWEDASVDWESFDLVIVRSPWNYTKRLAEFMQWLHDRSAMANFHNSASLIAWNLDKHYLAELAMGDVAVVPTTYADDADGLERALDRNPSAMVIVKPVTSAGSRLTGRFVTGSSAALDLGRQILAENLTVMIQPFAESVDSSGEIGTVVFDGSISHSFRKGPLLGDEGQLRGGEYREVITPAELADDERSLVLRAHSVVRELALGRGWLGSSGELLYGRYDIVRLDDGTPALLEAELAEPSFFFGVDPDSAQRFVDAAVRRL
jgi:O-ureido-D-serine cyclo-ligase